MPPRAPTTKTCRGVGSFMAEKGTHGGPGRGQGRKPVRQGEQTVTLSLRVTLAQRAKLAQLGGAEWVRQQIDNTAIGEIEQEHIA